MKSWYLDTMKILALMSQKGGSGKTTLAVHLAVAAQESGETVALLDTDPQQSATLWGSTRAAAGRAHPSVQAIAASGLESSLQRIQAAGATLTIIDTAPHAAPAAATIARYIDLTLIPCRPAAFDIAALQKGLAIVRAAGKPGVIVLSACPPRSPEIAETRELLAQQKDFPLFPGLIADRRAFARAVASGRAVTEFESTGKAAAEIQALWKYTKGQLWPKRRG